MLEIIFGIFSVAVLGYVYWLSAVKYSTIDEMKYVRMFNQRIAYSSKQKRKNENEKKN